jgi:hypothetical protein
MPVCSSQTLVAQVEAAELRILAVAAAAAVAGGLHQQASASDGVEQVVLVVMVETAEMELEAAAARRSRLCMRALNLTRRIRRC